MKSDVSKMLQPVTGSIYFKVAIVVIIIAVVVAIAKRLALRDDYSKEAGKLVDKDELTFSNLEYQNMAQRLFDAMSGAGTDEDTIYSILRMLRTRSDWFKLVDVFGVRESDAFYSGWSGNLMEWLVDELNSSEQEEVANILSRIGVIF
ncbi:MAG: hypothetical protein PHV07_02880 [Oscillospiraceae bacterium]|nr:hypothetical protein [Oscillospiraceae bacterium]